MNNEPLAVEWIQARVNGKPGHRLMVVLAAPGCSYAFGPTGGCTNCSFPSAFGLRHKVTIEEYESQLKLALGKIPSCEDSSVEVDLYVSGSFLNPAEVSPQAQQKLVSIASRAPCVHKVTIETRPEFVSTSTLQKLLKSMANIEVAIGLESSDDIVRDQMINKGFSFNEFERAAEILSQSGASLMVYLLLKPMGMGERQAIEDVVRSAGRVFSMANDMNLKTRIALEPCFVGPGTVLEQEFKIGEYNPPWLWSVVEATERISKIGPVIVGLSDEGLNPKRQANNCEMCSGTIRNSLSDFNVSADPSVLRTLQCSCKKRWEKLVAL